MKFRSTRSNTCVAPSYALLHGLAPDGGLYVPETFPEQVLQYKDLAGKSYQEIASVVLSYFFTNFTDEERNAMIASAYNETTFRDERIVPLHSIDTDVSISELFHGRTLAFKDLALSLFPYLLTAAKAQEKEDRDILILTATSGDTGKAALEGFKDVAGTNIMVFYPSEGVSPMQKQQMQKQEGNNVNVSAIYGNFDDAQSFLKRVFVDPDVYSLKGEEELSSLYRDLERDYLASVFLTRPSSELLNSYVESIAPPGLSLPPKAKIREDVDVLASSLFLAYYRFSPGEAARYKSFYDGGYRFAYHQNAALSYEVPYVPFHNSNGPILVSKEEAASCFEGASINVGGDVAISFFLPEAGIMPDEIIADVVKGNYEKRASGHYMEPGSDYEWGYDLRAYFPYFKTQSNVDLMPALGKELPSFLQKGLIGRLLDEHSASSRIVESRQLSNVSFDYNGLAIASLTYHGGATEPAPSPYRKEIYFDRPFAYISNQTLNVGGERLSLPILGGYVVETNYL